MNYRRLGKAGIKVSELSFGAWVTFGGPKAEEVQSQCMKACFDAGINFFDNAEAYGNGQAEIVMGNVIKSLGLRRQSLVLSTKIFWGGSGPNDSGLSHKHVIEGTHAALRRLQTDYVDLLFCHRPDPDTPIEETVRAMDILVRQGKAFYWGTSEWSAQLLWNDPRVAPERQATLLLRAWASRGDRTCAETVGRWVALTNYARLHYAAEPLPRFSDDWAYGDVHYHSQSTDNEGESGYAYRAVATTLGAMGVDFVLASDHASSSEQVVDISATGGEVRRGARDLTQTRWDAAQEYLHGAGAANAEGAAFGGARGIAPPRVFLGAEVDVMPEVPVAPTSLSVAGWTVPYGNGQRWNLLDSEDGVCDGHLSSAIDPCPTLGYFAPFTDVYGHTAYAVKDVQGLGALVGRQHLIYLPRYRDVAAGLVASRTTDYGGASRHLIEGGGVLDEITSKHGFAFLAHPLAGGGGDKGPGMVPYSQYQYEKVFGNPAFKGLQLWNENNRVSSNAGEFGEHGYRYLDPFVQNDGSVQPGFLVGEFALKPVHQLGRWEWTTAGGPASALHNGTAQWDKLLRWGLDLDRTRAISWLPAGEPRRVFMAGGSDAHGDFNYRREGYATGLTKTTDTALARVRNLVEVGAPVGRCTTDGRCYARDTFEPGYAQDQVVDAMSEGRFMVTDGPALRIVVDRNNNQQIDAGDLAMGGTVDLYGDEQLPLLIEARSTTELGDLDSIDLYVGVDHDPVTYCAGGLCLVDPPEGRARTYAPVDHGVRGIYRDTVTGVNVSDPSAHACAGDVCQMEDGYWLPSPAVRSTLRIQASELVAGKKSIRLNLNDFPTGGLTARASRVYVRAFVRTFRPCVSETGHGTFFDNCFERYGYTNPVWALRRPASAACAYSDRALDDDGDGVANACDPAPTVPAIGSWTRVFGGNDVDGAYATAVDRDNNVWVAGGLRTAGRIEGAGGGGLSDTQDDDAVVLKYSPTGALLGKLVVGGAGLQVVTGLAIRDDDVYLVGTTQGSTTIGGFSWQTDTRDPFVARLARADLTVLSTNRITGGGSAEGRAIAIGSGGQIAVIGDFSGALWTLQPSLVAEGATDCFVAWFSSTTLQLQSLVPVTGSGTCTARRVVVDALGRATAAYEYTGTITLSASTQRTTVGTDVMIARYLGSASSFLVDWGVFIGSPTNSKLEPGDAWVNALALAADSGVYIGGAFTGSLIVWGTSWKAGAVSAGGSTGGTDGYVLRVGANGALAATPNARINGPGAETVTGLAVDSRGALAVAGKMTSATGTFGAAALTRQSAFEDDLLGWITPSGAMVAVRQLQPSGLAAWGNLAASPSFDRVAGAATFSGSARFDDVRTVTSASATTADGAAVLQLAPAGFGLLP